MRIHILGICGTFMSGIAILAKQKGFYVTGSDINVYPPISSQLAEQGIPINEGYHPEHIPKDVDCVVVGNVIKRGNKAIECVLDKRIPYTSGPAWLAENVLKDRHVLAVSGTHGKTTTSSILTWILESAGLNPGFLIGGVPQNFASSARLGEKPYFVIEADEYDSAFFDKRSKFIHYRPKAAILNNLEYDHADIFPDLKAIQQQFHYFVRTLPSNGCILHHAGDNNVKDVLSMGCWTPQVTFGNKGEWQANLIKPDGSQFDVFYRNTRVGKVDWSLLGLHNVDNALAALAAATFIDVDPERAISSLSSFKNVKRRMEIKGKINEVMIYDDFAHHPTAIATTLAGLRAKIGNEARMIAVLEFGSYTMRSGVHKDKLITALEAADLIFCKRPEMEWGLDNVFSTCERPVEIHNDTDSILTHLSSKIKSGDHVIIMSNSSFGGIHKKLIEMLQARGTFNE